MYVSVCAWFSFKKQIKFFLTFIEVRTQWVACKVSAKGVKLTLLMTHCVKTSMNVRKMKFISSIYIILGMFSTNCNIN